MVHDAIQPNTDQLVKEIIEGAVDVAKAVGDEKITNESIAIPNVPNFDFCSTTIALLVANESIAIPNVPNLDFCLTTIALPFTTRTKKKMLLLPP